MSDFAVVLCVHVSCGMGMGIPMLSAGDRIPAHPVPDAISHDIVLISVVGFAMYYRL